MCSGSETDQMNLIPVLFTLMETVVLNVRRVSRLDLHRNVSTASVLLFRKFKYSSVKLYKKIKLTPSRSTIDYFLMFFVFPF